MAQFFPTGIERGSESAPEFYRELELPLNNIEGDSDGGVEGKSAQENDSEPSSLSSETIVVYFRIEWRIANTGRALSRLF